MVNNENTACFNYEVERKAEGKVLEIDCNQCSFPPSIEDSATCMSKTVDVLNETDGITKIILTDKKDHEYDYNQTQILTELAQKYKQLIQSDRLSYSNLVTNQGCEQYLQSSYSKLKNIIFNTLKRDPISAYVKLKRQIRTEKINQDYANNQKEIECSNKFIKTLQWITQELEETQIINMTQQYMEGYEVGDRDAYREIFNPTIKPDFMFTKLMSQYPSEGEVKDSYNVNNSEVTIFTFPDNAKTLYHLVPPEFKFSEDKYEILDTARRIMSEHEPEEEEFVDPDRMREVFYNVGRDLIQDLLQYRNLNLTSDEIDEIAEVLTRYTVGFGLIEVLLNDERVQDISVNSPVGSMPIFLVHQDFDDCETNITPSKQEAQSWATKLRLISGRPLDESNPILDTELRFGDIASRVAAVTKPLNPTGLAFSFRRHRSDPWTLPLFMDVDMLNAQAAGLLSFLIDGTRTMLIAGTRSSGKCLEGGELIQKSNGELKPIKQIVENTIENNPENTVEIEDGYRCKPENLEVTTLNENLETTKQEVEWVWKRKPKKLYNIKLKSGKEINCTPEHPLFTVENGEIKNKRADDFTEGEQIATPRNIPVEGNRKKLLESIKNTEFEFNTNAVKVDKPENIKKLMEFAGYIYGDGHVKETGISFYSGNKKIINRFKEITKDLFNYQGKIRKDKRNNTYYFEINSRTLSNFIKETLNIPFGKKASKLNIPSKILSLPDEDIKHFIRAIFDCEGHVQKNERRIEFSTKSRKLSQKIQLILQRFGIITKETEKTIEDEKYYRLHISGSEINKYNEKIGFKHSNKKEQLKKQTRKETIDNTNKDIIPESNELIKELREKLRITPTQIREKTGKDIWAYENKKYNVTRKWFKKITKEYEKRYQKLKKLKEKIQTLKEIKLNEEEIKEYKKKIQKVKNILRIPYKEISSGTDFSPKGIKKTITGKSKTSFENLENINKSVNNTITEYKNQPVDIKNSVQNLPEWIDKTSLTYKELSEKTNIPTTSIKQYAYKGTKTPEKRKEKIISQIKVFKKEWRKKRNKAQKIIKDLEKQSEKIKEKIEKTSQATIILKELREKLNIQNEELSSENISKNTVSNFFNGTYQPKLETLQEIINQVIKIYEETVNKETEEKIENVRKLAKSDIYWDEIEKIEKKEPENEWVYDFTLPNSNFTANGIIAHNTSLLGSMLVEILRRFRMITIEDTLELPVEALRELGHNIQSLKVASALSGENSTGVDASKGIRSTLRLGDSAIIMGEVRSDEAISLYEAMRVGAAANVVAGTIHGASPYDVYDRVVNDIGVPKTSFKATDIVVVANPVKTAGGLGKQRRVLQITEVRKKWEDDPEKEGAFVDLMKYNPETDQLEVTDALANGNSQILKEIASNIKELSGSWQAVWDNIQLRSDVKQAMVDIANDVNDKSLLEADFVTQGNEKFHRIMDDVREEQGELDSDRILFEFKEWLKKEVKKKKS